MHLKGLYHKCFPWPMIFVKFSRTPYAKENPMANLSQISYTRWSKIIKKVRINQQKLCEHYKTADQQGSLPIFSTNLVAILLGILQSIFWSWAIIFSQGAKVASWMNCEFPLRKFWRYQDHEHMSSSRKYVFSLFFDKASKVIIVSSLTKTLAAMN